MPANNRFRHQTYPTKPAIEPRQTTLHHEVAEGIKQRFGKLHDELGIREVVLVHGTFAGNDPFAISEIMRAVAGDGWMGNALRSMADRLTSKTKNLTDKFAKDVGNYTKDYRNQFRKLVGPDPQVHLLDPTWSSQNHHFARADLAVRLLVHLDDLNLDTDNERVMLWGHSHAGNGFALLTNLLANHRPSVKQFFDAVPDPPEHWKRAKTILESHSSPSPLGKSVIVAAFGTPVRYGWDTNGYRTLIHILHHRPEKKGQITCKPLFPPYSFGDTMHARHGDWVQALGISRTDVPPPTSIKQHRALGELFETGLDAPEITTELKLIFPQQLRELCAYWKTGTRCHNDGVNLLVDYEPCGRKTVTRQPIEESLFGHGVATVQDWLERHLALVMHWIESSTGA